MGRSEKSGFEKFLHSIVPKSWNWSIGNLLEEADKWSDGVKPNKQVDMWKIRSSVARSFSEYIDDSTSLTRPSSFSTKANLSPIRSESRPLYKK